MKLLDELKKSILETEEFLYGGEIDCRAVAYIVDEFNKAEEKMSPTEDVNMEISATNGYTKANAFSTGTYSFSASPICDMKNCTICESLELSLSGVKKDLKKSRRKNTKLKRAKNLAQRRWVSLNNYATSLEAEIEEIADALHTYSDSDILSLISTYKMRDELLTKVQKVIEASDDNIMLQVSPDIFMEDILQENCILRNQVGELQLQTLNQALAAVNLKADKERLTKSIFNCTIGFPVDISVEASSETIDALTWYCLKTDGDAETLVAHFEMWGIVEGIDDELDTIIEAYRCR